MTAKEYIDEVKLRLMRIGVTLSLTDQLILTYINRARREVQKHTMDLFPERYGKVQNILLANLSAYTDFGIKGTGYSGRAVAVRRGQLSADFIKQYVVLVKYSVGENVIFSEARYMTKPEMYAIGMHAFNTTTLGNPAYTCERSMADNNWYIFIADLDADATATVSGIYIYYIAAIHDLEDTAVVGAAYVNDTELVIPPDAEEMVVYYTMLYCMQNIAEESALESIRGDIGNLMGLLQTSYYVEKRKMGILIPSKEGL